MIGRLSSQINCSALGKKHWNEVEWACIIAEFSNSTRTNNFYMVGSRESSSYTEEEHSSQRIICLSTLNLKLSTEKLEWVVNEKGVSYKRILPVPQMQSSHHKVMLTWEPTPKLNFCIIPWFVESCLPKMEGQIRDQDYLFVFLFHSKI